MNREIHVSFVLNSGLQNQENKTVENQPYSHPENSQLKKTQVSRSSSNLTW